MWYLIVSIPDLCILNYFEVMFDMVFYVHATMESTLKYKSFSYVLLSAFVFLFQRAVNAIIISRLPHHYVRSDLVISPLQMLSAEDTSM